MAENRTLFSSLRKLFSTDVIIRNVGGNQLKVVDTDHLQSSGNLQNNSRIDRFIGRYKQLEVIYRHILST